MLGQIVLDVERSILMHLRMVVSSKTKLINYLQFIISKFY